MGLPRSGITVRCGGGAVVEAAGRGGAEYTGRGPVCGTISRLGGGAAGLCTVVAGLVGGAGVCEVTIAPGASVVGFSTSTCGAGATSGGASTTAAGPSTGFVSSGSGGFASTVSTAIAASTIGGGVGVSTAGGGVTGGFGGMITAAGRATVCGVIRRGAGFRTSTGAIGAAFAVTAGGFGATLGGRDGTAAAGVTLVRGGTGGVTGRDGAAGWAAFWVIAFKTSPGLEMCDKSIFGLNSSLAGWIPLAGAPPPSPCSE